MFWGEVFVGVQTVYILWTWLIECLPRATISVLFMFTCRGILGYSTQLPLTQEFVGSGVDFPVGNVSFFLFFSGHVAGSVIASFEMRRMRRWELAWLFDTLNVLQAVRLQVKMGCQCSNPCVFFFDVASVFLGCLHCLLAVISHLSIFFLA
ncbi:hypothetical protein POUND7_003885 [Theobroma cacao]